MASSYLKTSLPFKHCIPQQVTTWKRLKPMQFQCKVLCTTTNWKGSLWLLKAVHYLNVFGFRFHIVQPCFSISNIYYKQFYVSINLHIYSLIVHFFTYFIVFCRRNNFNARNSLTANIENYIVSEHRSSDKSRNHSTTIIEHETATELDHDQPESLLSSIIAKFELLRKFSRPYAILGTALGVASCSLIPLETISEISPRFFFGVLQAALPMMLIHLFTNGINQLFDVEMDKVNKPFLPIASGKMSMKTGVAIVAIASSLSIVMGIMIQSPPLLCAILTFFAFGGAYSIDFPFLRWKSNAILAAICIMGARAFSIQICVFLHIQRYVLGKPMAFTRSSVLATVFMCMFAVVVSVLKDIPDMDGDEAFGTKSLAILLGKEKAFWFGTSLLMMTYGVAMGVGASAPLMYSKLVTVLGHGILASILWLRAKSVNISDHEAVSAFYRFVWKLLYAEYLLIPFVH